jgi:hypothetical protein
MYVKEKVNCYGDKSNTICAAMSVRVKEFTSEPSRRI